MPPPPTPEASGEPDDSRLACLPTQRPVKGLGFEGKLIKRLCGQGFLFVSLQPGWGRTIFWFESRDMTAPYVREMIRSLEFGMVYRFKDVIDYTPFIHTGK